MNFYMSTSHVRTSLRLITGGLGLCLLSLGSMKTASAQSTIFVPGVIRDFQKSHSDFDIIPVGGYGHYAGNIQERIGPDYRPILIGGGFRVDAQWRNAGANPIPPHLYAGKGEIRLTTLPTTHQAGMFDSWDSSLGSYVGQIPGLAPDITIVAGMPTIADPALWMDPSTGNVRYNAGASILNRDLHCNNLTLQLNAVLTIEGHVTILCDANFNMAQFSRIEIAPNSSLRLYFKNIFSVSQNCVINTNTWDPSLVIIYNLGTKKLDISQDTNVVATIISPNAILDLGQNVQFYGTFVGESISLFQGSMFHNDKKPPSNACGVLLDAKGTPGVGSTGGITSPNSYEGWYRDTLGTNLSQLHYITLVRNGSGVYEYNTTAFHPIDDRLYGNEGESHNYNFTFTINASFVYNACENQYFEFEGSDDAWIFIDGRLGLDLGGVLPGTNQVVEMDRMNLVDGQTYQVQFFYAQRQSVRSEFGLRTNIGITPSPFLAAGTAAFD